MSSKAFTAKTFAFLHQVNHNPRLQKIDVAVALELTVYFNESDHDGRAWPGCKTVADAIGVSETTVIRSVHRLATEGHLRVIWGSQGRGHPHQYWMVVKPAPVKVSKAGKPAPVMPGKPASVKIKPAPVQENLLTNLHRRLEREGAQAREPILEGGRLAGAAPFEKEESGLPRKEEGTGPGSRTSFKSEAFAELRTVWARPWADDPDADRRAWEVALGDGADAGEIIEAARA